ncbi:MAG: aldo/keto reductase, partial [Sphingobacteriales bacterium]
RRAVDELSAMHDVQPASVAIAWLLAQPNIDAPIASATSESQFAALFAADELVER